jgi:hypothetical protein
MTGPIFGHDDATRTADYRQDVGRPGLAAACSRLSGSVTQWSPGTTPNFKAKLQAIDLGILTWRTPSSAARDCQIDTNHAERRRVSPAVPNHPGAPNSGQQYES